jgi:hypothetical protein
MDDRTVDRIVEQATYVRESVSMWKSFAALA